ncbi:CDP-diacylglycerol--serine O-phosphatidyltransferase 1 [Zea mays]|uniref:CDP-diacylglycerol--serine O-phosphatidyltransferase 1 n=1 Tax=Zea mays TaxID=4577 RepID=A0A1D6HK41_MAIZE|nr:CDP-diacylglycerol--serine O-phosphatidyltransferase 1 [Zea mays]AQK74821.1 CDP-diacylglycerol--serine O-phosphatidyltransferase 1 [Zea mays]
MPFHVLASSTPPAIPLPAPAAPAVVLAASRGQPPRPQITRPCPSMPANHVTPSIHGSRAPSAPFHPWSRIPTRRDSSHTLPLRPSIHGRGSPMLRSGS